MQNQAHISLSYLGNDLCNVQSNSLIFVSCKFHIYILYTKWFDLSMPVLVHIGTWFQVVLNLCCLLKETNMLWYKIYAKGIQKVSLVISYFDPPMFTSHGCTARPPNGHLRSRHTSGRTCLTPYGNQGYLFVKVGDILSHRFLILVLLASWCGLRWLMEQPDGSYMPQLPRFQWLYGVVKAWGVETNRFFGGPALFKCLGVPYWGFVLVTPFIYS